VQSLDQLDSDAFDTLLQSGRLDPEDNECATSA
jgi:hypothetical protein